MRTLVRRSLPAVLALSLLCPLAAQAQNAPAASPFSELGRKHAGSIVTLKFVLKYAGAQGEEEQESETSGVMIDPGGLILCSDQSLGGRPAAWKQFLASHGGFSLTPKDIKVMVGEDTEGVEAKLIGRDGDLDLAWVQIDKPAKAYDTLDFSAAATPAVGEVIYSLRRMSKFFDRVPLVEEGRVGAFVAKPRKLLVPVGDVGQPFGTPVFSASGAVVGLCVLQLPNPEETEAQTGGVRSMINNVVLLASDIVTATARVREAFKAGKPMVDPEPEPAAAAPGPEPVLTPAAPK